jgi:hypothetical protein
MERQKKRSIKICFKFESQTRTFSPSSKLFYEAAHFLRYQMMYKYECITFVNAQKWRSIHEKERDMGNDIREPIIFFFREGWMDVEWPLFSLKISENF